MSPPMESAKAAMSCNSTFIILNFDANMPTKRSEKQIFAPIYSQFFLPGIFQKGFDIGLRDGFSVDFLETGHEQLHVFDRDVLACAMVEAGMDFLG